MAKQQIPSEEKKNLILEIIDDRKAENPVVIDLRDSVGGSPQLVQYLISHFVPEGTLLWDLFDRSGKSTEQVRSLAVPDSELLKTKPLYILQSEKLVKVLKMANQP